MATERSGISSRSSRTQTHSPRETRRDSAREESVESGAALLGALTSAYAPAGQLSAEAVQLLTHGAGNSAVCAIFRAGGARARSAPVFPGGAPPEGTELAAPETAFEETGAAEGLSELAPLDGGAALNG